MSISPSMALKDIGLPGGDLAEDDLDLAVRGVGHDRPGDVGQGDGAVARIHLDLPIHSLHDHPSFVVAAGQSERSR